MLVRNVSYFIKNLRPLAALKEQYSAVRNSTVQYRTVQYSKKRAARGLVSEKVVKLVNKVRFLLERYVSYLS